jgi:signal recognition particle subunit SRP72
LFTSLCAQIDGGHFNNAIKTCDKILRLEPNDGDALQTKLFLLLQTDQYNAALSLIGACGDHSSYAFERAYSFYRLQREAEAAEALSVVKQKEGEEERAVLHLEAQLSYRQGFYQAAFDVYNQLLDTAEPQSEEHSDILTNLQASQMQLDFINNDFLRALDGLPSSLNLESSAPPQPNSSAASLLASSSAARSSPADNEIVKKVKKVRMARVPAGVVPGVTPPPDPERWLKKSERSSFGQGKRRKGGGGGGATQGSTDSPAGNSSSSKSTPGSHVSKGKKKK